MSEQTTHLLLVSIYVFCAFVFGILLFFFPIIGLLWGLVVVLATLVHALCFPAPWSRERARANAAWRRFRQRLGSKLHPKEETAYDTDLHADHELECLNPGCRASRVLTEEALTNGLVIGRNNPEYTELHKNTDVSRNHCKITYRRHSHEYYVEDLRSRNGTFLDTKRLEPYSPEKLLDGNVITICGIQYRFQRVRESGVQK